MMFGAVSVTDAAPMFVRFDVDEDALSDSDVIVTIFVLIPYHVYIHFPTNSMLSGNKGSFF